MNFNELQILRLAYNLNQLASNQVGSSAESRCRKSIGIENLIVLRAYRATSNNNQFVNLTALLLISPSTHVHTYTPTPDSEPELDDQMYQDLFFVFLFTNESMAKESMAKEATLELWKSTMSNWPRLECAILHMLQPKNKTIREEAGASLRSLGPIEPRLEWLHADRHIIGLCVAEPLAL